MDVVLGTAARILVLAVLATGGLEKFRAHRAFATAVGQLGFRPARAWAVAVCAGELAVAALMIVPVPAWASAAAVAGVGTVFAAAGVRAVRLRARIRCTCFGRLGRGRDLGWRQVAAWPAWLVAAAVVAWWEPAGAVERMTVVTGAVAAVTVAYSWLVVRVTGRARADRVALIVREPPEIPGGVRRIAVPAVERQLLKGIGS
jgi:hypothetical protein